MYKLSLIIPNYTISWCLNHNDDVSVLEDTLSELQLLPKRQPLRDEDLLRSKDLMASLKEAVIPIKKRLF